jgi:hypothetical protein
MRGRAHRAAAAAISALALGLAGDARAERPSFAPGAEPLVHDGQHVRVHYVVTSADAVPDDDADKSGTPDYVDEVAALTDTAWEDLVARGFRPPVTDAGLVPDDGGDDRFDIYLLDLESADGNFVAEACTAEAPVHCAGFFAMENDLAGFGYASRTEGISVLTSHELFHAVQSAYAPGTAIAWSEGTAVWNEEQTFPEQDDFETFVPYFLERSYRPFDRAGSGFGDPYPYGAALWPSFLEERHGDGLVRRAWEACERRGEGADFLAAIEEVLSEDGESLEAAWIEFSRWNLFTGQRADPERAYRAGAELGAVSAEPELAAPGATETTIEGLSARYLPIAAEGSGPLQIAVEVDDGAVAAFFAQNGASGPIGEETELEREGGVLVAPLPADGRGILVVTGIRRGGLPRDVGVQVRDAPLGGGDEDGGCQAARSSSGHVPETGLLLLAALALLCRRLAPHLRSGETR